MDATNLTAPRFGAGQTRNTDNAGRNSQNTRRRENQILPTHTQPSTREVTFTISPQARKRSQDPDCEFREALEQMRERMAELTGLMSQECEQSNVMDIWRKKAILLKIATRIMNGDDVPLRDHKFLAEHNIELYKKAVSLRRVNDDPEEHDALSDGERANRNMTAVNDALRVTSTANIDLAAGSVQSLPQ